MKQVGRILLVIIITFMLARWSATTVFAQDAAPNTTQDFWFQHFFDVFSQIIIKKSAKGALQLEGGAVANFNGNLAGFVGGIIGWCDLSTTLATAADNQSTDNTSECPSSLGYQNSALAKLSNGVIALYMNPPASTYDFAMDMGQTLGFVTKKTYAQGIGFSGLAAILPLWKAFRDVAYLLLAVALLVVGFMVMFRKKIDPKTVVTVQSAIPRIVVALILVTFSYAIVGIMIDLMYLSIVLIVSILTPAGTGIMDPKAFSSQILGDGFGGVFTTMVWFGTKLFGDIANMFSGGNPILKVGAPALLGILGFMMGGIKGAAIGAAALPLLLVAIIAVALIFGLVRLFFLILDAYINIIIALLVAPLQLMTEAIPGTNSFSSWFRNLLAKLSVFPVSAGLLYVAGILAGQDSTKSLWTPPFLTPPPVPAGIPLVGGTQFAGSGIGGVIGLGMIMVIPNIVGAIQKALKAEPAVPGGLGTIFGPMGAGVGQLFGLVYQGSFVYSALRHKPETRTPMQVVRQGAEKGFGAISPGGGASEH